MADHFNHYPLRHFAGNVADCMGLSLPEQFAPPIPWVCDILKERMGGLAHRVVLYHADAVGMYIWQKYPYLLAPVWKHASLAVPYVSTVMSVTPVAHASMYTGMDPAGHGIQTYVRPKLTCDTLYDVLLREGKTPGILSTEDSTFQHIFAGRDMDYFEEPNAAGIQSKALELIASDKYDVLSIHTFDYDSAAHAYGPESKEALNALSIEAEVFDRLARALRENAGGRRTLLIYAPDHGQHLTAGGTGAHGSTCIEDMNVMHLFAVI